MNSIYFVGARPLRWLLVVNALSYEGKVFEEFWDMRDENPHRHELMVSKLSKCRDVGSNWQFPLKRGFDILVSAIGLATVSWLIVITFLMATIDTGRSGFFRQERIGRHGKIFRIIKLRTMREHKGVDTTVTTVTDPRITRLGRIFRRYKLDELPQLWNVLIGDMSLVGPRPDVPGFADMLQGGGRTVLSIRPGITGPASLRFRNEEELLSNVADPERYNREVIFKEKVRLNLEYIESNCFLGDLKVIWQTIFPSR